MKEYMVLFEQGEDCIGASIPEIDGCVAVGDTLEEAKQLIKEALEIHLSAMEEDGDEIPKSNIIHAEKIAVETMPHR